MNSCQMLQLVGDCLQNTLALTRKNFSMLLTISLALRLRSSGCKRPTSICRCLSSCNCWRHLPHSLATDGSYDKNCAWVCERGENYHVIWYIFNSLTLHGFFVSCGNNILLLKGQHKTLCLFLCLVTILRLCVHMTARIIKMLIVLFPYRHCAQTHPINAFSR